MEKKPTIITTASATRYKEKEYYRHAVSDHYDSIVSGKPKAESITHGTDGTLQSGILKKQVEVIPLKTVRGHTPKEETLDDEVKKREAADGPLEDIQMKMHGRWNRETYAKRALIIAADTCSSTMA